MWSVWPVQGIEMIRKLLLSVIGSFWSTKSTMSIVTAFLISAFFLIIHTTYFPFKAHVLNRTQTLALTILTLLYFIGECAPSVASADSVLDPYIA